MSSSLCRVALLCAATLALGACGGGGGRGSASDVEVAAAPAPAPAPVPAPVPVPPVPTPPPPPPAGPAMLGIAGTVRYERVGTTVAGSTARLDYAAVALRPARGVAVEVIDAATQHILATTTTDGSGHYSAIFPAGSAKLRVRAKSRLQQGGGAGPRYDVAVVDNTSADAIYAIDSAPIAPGGAKQLTQDLVAGAGWDGAAYTGVRASGPFAVLDAVYSALAAAAGAAPDLAWPRLLIGWSVNNNSTGTTYDPAVGNIFSTAYLGADAHDLHRIYVMGKADDDTDEFDEHVIVHEWGHYLMAVNARDDSIGGFHALGDKLDMRVAFSEGWANGWSGIATGNPVYSDTYGPGQQQGFTLALANPAAQPGWYAEDAVQYLVYTLAGQHGLPPLFKALATDLREGDAPTSAFALKAALLARLPLAASGIEALFRSQGVDASDAWGSGQTDLGGIAHPEDLSPVIATYSSFGQPQTYCITPQFDPWRARNKLGEHRLVRFTLPADSARTITLAGGSDPDWVLANHGFHYDAVADSRATGIESHSLRLAGGTYVLALTDAAMADRSCLQLTISN